MGAIARVFGNGSQVGPRLRRILGGLLILRLVWHWGMLRPVRSYECKFSVTWELCCQDYGEFGCRRHESLP
jgi:hypothetical protein